MRTKNRLLVETLACVAAALATVVSSTHAAPVTWDVTTGDNAVVDGSDGWIAADHFTTDGGVTNFTWNNTANANDTAVFGAGGGTGKVNGSNGLTAGSMRVLTNYEFGSNWRLILTGGEIFVESGAIATFTFDVWGSAGITKTGPGTVRFSLANAYTGGTTINQGELALIRNNLEVIQAASGDIRLGDTSGAADVLLSIPNNAPWRIENDIIVRSGSTGTADIFYSKASGSGTGEFAGALTLDKDLTMTRGGTNIVDLTFSGPIGGPGNLTINHDVYQGGDIAFTADNTHTGSTTILGRTLSWTQVRFDGTQANGNLTLDTVAAAGSGTLRFNVEDDTADLIRLLGGSTFDLTGMTLEPIFTGTQTQAEYLLINTLAGVTGPFAAVLDTALFDFEVDYDGTAANPGAVVLTYTALNAAIPEPASGTLLGLGCLALLGLPARRLRRRRASDGRSR